MTPEREYSDFTVELEALQGISEARWSRLKNYVDAVFAETAKKNVLTVDEDIARVRLICFDKSKLDTRLVKDEFFSESHNA